MLKVSASYLKKQKSFISKKIFFGHSQYQNKKVLFTDSIFREGFGLEIIFFFFSFLSDMLATAILSSTQLLEEFKIELESGIAL